MIIDNETHKNYKALYEEIENNCFFDGEDGTYYIKLKDGGICPFLNEKGL